MNERSRNQSVRSQPRNSRNTSNQDWTIGIHAVVELLKRNPASIQRLMMLQGRDDNRHNRIRELAQKSRIRIEECQRHEFSKITEGVHQGVAALCEFSDPTKSESFLKTLLEQLEHPPFFLVLDGVTDPHNLGACLRSADAAGVDAVIVTKDKSASMNATVRKVASGAAETVNFVAVTNLQRCLQSLKDQGVWLVGADGDSEQNLHDQDLTGPIALVMGSEGSGLRRLTKETCDFLVRIPMAGTVSSLNVSVATGIVLFEAVRQRRGTP